MGRVFSSLRAAWLRLLVAGLALTGAGMAAVGAPAFAHHGFTGRYDTDQPLWITGTVERASFGSPHATLTLRTEAASVGVFETADLPYIDGQPVAMAPDTRPRVTIEFPPVAAFFELNRKLKVGDKVSVIALQNCIQDRQLRSQWIRLADGSVTSRDMQMSYMVKGCPRS
jgi:hypothetical protein